MLERMKPISVSLYFCSITELLEVLPYFFSFLHFVFVMLMKPLLVPSLNLFRRNSPQHISHWLHKIRPVSNIELEL